MSDVEDEFAGLPEDEEILDDEAGEGSGDGEGEGDSVDSSEEEEDGENEYEADGFLVDEEEGEGEGEGEDSDQEIRKAKKKRKKRNFALDEEDYELLEDNQVRVKRPAERKRLKRRGDGDAPGREKASGAKQLQEALFGTGDLEDELEEDGARATGDHGPDDGGGSPRRNRYDDFGDMSDEMDDFIVDRGDGDRRRARRRRDARMAEAAGLSTAAVQAANRLFGNFGELLDLHQSHRMYGEGAGGLEDELEEEEEPEEETLDADEDEAERKRLERLEKAAARKQQKLLAQVDPELVESHFLRPADQTIRQLDVPERLQLLGKSALELAREEDRRQVLDDAARWVTEHLFGSHSQASKIRDVVEDGILEVTGECRERIPGLPPGVWPHWMLQDVDDDLDLRNNRALLVRRGKRYRDYESYTKEQRAAEERRIHERFKSNQEEQNKLQTNVRAVLEHVFESSEEIPLQAMYRKEACGELLALRETDMPETTGNEEKAPSEADVRWPKGTIQPKHRRIRRWDVLWAVFNWGVRAMELHKRRSRRFDQYNRAFEAAATEEEKDDIMKCVELLTAKLHTPQGLDDIDAKFRHIMDITSALSDLSLENGESSAHKVRRPGRPTAVRRYIKLGLTVPAHEVSISMDDFRENIEQKNCGNPPEDPSVPPLEWARRKIQELGLDMEEEAGRMGLLARPQGFLDAIKEVLAAELAAEPCLRNVVRNELYQQAVLNTNPTPSGEDTLDPFHPYGITKHLVDKKVQTLENHDTWLRVQAAERQGLITSTITYPEKQLADLLHDIEELFLSDNTADVAVDWNNWRRDVLITAVRMKLLPQMLSELKGRLTANAVDTVLGLVQDKFWHFVSQPPVRIMEVPDEQDQEPVQMEAPRFMAVVWGSGQGGDGPTTIVQLDGQGNLKDILTAAQLSGNVPRTVNSNTREMPVFDPAADPKKSRDSHKIRDKILEHKPNAILVSTTAPQSKQLKDDMEKISQYTESDARFKDELLPHLENKRVEVMWADDRVASLWANSDAAKAEFPDYSYLVRKAVGVARMALDPLAIIAVLLGKKKEVLSLRMHELQDKLPSEQLLTRLEQTLITAVAQVGVDINAICENPWRQAPLQFVPGLGPRKARQLLASIAANDNHLKTRMDLLKQDDNVFGASAPTDVAQMGRTVFRNAAPFIRVRRGEVQALQNEEEFDALDDARVNPEDEALLQVILEEAFPDLGEQGAGVDVRTAIESPNNLLQLDLYAVAEANSYLFKLPTLVDMMFELLAPYGELRLHSAVPSDEVAFYLRHGETEESLKDGKLVEAKVVWVGETEVKVIIQNNNMEAIIPQNAASSDNSALRLSDVFKPGMVVPARIRNNPDAEEVYYDENQRRRYTVTLTTATAALEDFDTWERRYCSDVDRSYKPLPNKRQQAQQQQLDQARMTPSAASRSGKQPLQKRQCDHPLFKKQRVVEVVNDLKNAPVGTAFFHPYHKPTVAEQLSCIQLSVKLADLPTGPLIYHVEVKESASKRRGEPKVVPPFRIQVPGKGDNKSDHYEQFEDLDEVMARYVEPMVEHVTDVSSHRKYVMGDMSSVNEQLRAQLALQPANSSSGVYCVALDSHRPGNGYIAFGSGAAGNVHREYFSIIPSGFYFRLKTYPSVEHVISVFKAYPNFKKEQAAKQRQQGPQGYGLTAAAASGGMMAQAPGYHAGAAGYGAAQAVPGPGAYGYAGQQQYRQPGGYQGPPPAAAAPAGYSQPPGYGYSQQGGYQQGGYQQHGYRQRQPQYSQGYSYGR